MLYTTAVAIVPALTRCNIWTDQTGQEAQAIAMICMLYGGESLLFLLDWLRQQPLSLLGAQCVSIVALYRSTTWVGETATLILPKSRRAFCGPARVYIRNNEKDDYIPPGAPTVCPLSMLSLFPSTESRLPHLNEAHTDLRPHMDKIYVVVPNSGHLDPRLAIVRLPPLPAYVEP